MSLTSRSASADAGANGKRQRVDPVTVGVRWLDDRLGLGKGGRALLDKIFPDHWSFLLG